MAPNTFTSGGRSASPGLGYFEGLARICNELRRNEASAGILRHLDALNRYYLDKQSRPDLRSEFEYFGKGLQGGQHLCEIALLNAREGRKKVALAWVKVIGRFIDEQKGRLVYHHVSPILELAEFARANQETRNEATKLLNVSLSASTYALSSDLRRLANLLLQLHAPVVLWAD
jgi:hypothetical protein